MATLISINLNLCHFLQCVTFSTARPCALIGPLRIVSISNCLVKSPSNISILRAHFGHFTVACCWRLKKSLGSVSEDILYYGTDTTMLWSMSSALLCSMTLLNEALGDISLVWHVRLSQCVLWESSSGIAPLRGDFDFFFCRIHWHSCVKSQSWRNQHFSFT